MLGLLIAVIIGIGLVAKEVEKRSIYSLLSRPVTREQLILGKYLGLVMTLAVNIGAMVAAFYLRAVVSAADVAGVATGGVARARDRSAPADRRRS